MKIPSLDHFRIEYYHQGKTPWVRCYDLETMRETTVPADFVAKLCGISRQTLSRWCDGSQKLPDAAARLIQVVVLGVMPWAGWEKCRVREGLTQHNEHRWMIVSSVWP